MVPGGGFRTLHEAVEKPFRIQQLDVRIRVGGHSRLTGAVLDDSQRLAKLVMLTGTLVLTSVWLLITKEQLDTRRSQLRNVSMIFGFLLEFACLTGEACRDNEDGWKHTLVTICKGYNVFESGPWDTPNIMKAVSKHLKEAAENAAEDDGAVASDTNEPEDEVPNRWKAYEGETRSWRTWDFGYEVGIFLSNP